MRRTWLLVIVVVASVLVWSPAWLWKSAWLATAAVNAAVPLLAAAALAWFAYYLCLRPRVRLRKLYRMRVRQGRRHPLA